ncbi:MAG TPA: hypothetical protein VKX17_07470 [Planctomycetota bacterium]|nr:hypothetical protein [Planctomycetota bacterium]
MRILELIAVPCVCLIAAAAAAEESATDLEAKGIAALKQSQDEPDVILTAAINFGKAAAAYEQAKDDAKAVEMNSFLYWCKKRMTLQQMDAFLKGGDVVSIAVAKRMETVVKTIPPPDEAQTYFDRAEAYAKENPNEHLLIAIRFFEVADRFKGTNVSINAQDRSLKEQQISLSSGGKVPPVQLPASKPSVPAGRQPIPAAAAVATAQKHIREVFKNEFAATATADVKRSLPAKLLEQVAGEADSGARYALIREALEAAIRNADAASAGNAVDVLGKFYEVDPTEENLAALGRLSPARGDAAQASALIGELQRAAERALDADAYSKLPKFSALAKGIAGRIGNKHLSDELQAWAKDLDDVSKEWSSTEKAAAKLAASPNDAAANFTLGRFYLFYRNDLERSLPALARGSDEKLKSIALHELARPQESAPMTALGDEWAAYGEKQRDPFRLRALNRAIAWYRKALPDISGLEKSRVEKRLEELDAAAVGAVTAAESGTGKPSLRLRRRVPVQVEFVACADDEADIYINGKSILHAGFQGTASATCELQLGDIISVKVTDFGEGYGFACVIKTRFGVSIRTNKNDWRSYIPESKDTWWNIPDANAAKKVEARTSSTGTKVNRSSGLQCEPIWPAGIGGKTTGYLYFVVAEDSFTP